MLDWRGANEADLRILVRLFSLCGGFPTRLALKFAGTIGRAVTDDAFTW
jgi:hypothetical protein